jgi:hypothetical protein
MNSSIFWDITPCSVFKVKHRFGITCQAISKKEKYAKQEASMNLVACRAEDGGNTFL